MLMDNGHVLNWIGIEQITHIIRYTPNETCTLLLHASSMHRQYRSHFIQKRHDHFQLGVDYKLIRRQKEKDKNDNRNGGESLFQCACQQRKSVYSAKDDVFHIYNNICNSNAIFYITFVCSMYEHCLNECVDEFVNYNVFLLLSLILLYIRFFFSAVMFVLTLTKYKMLFHLLLLLLLLFLPFVYTKRSLQIVANQCANTNANSVLQ